MDSYPYEAIASKRYKSPHKNDLSFAKGDRIRVLSLAPKDDDEEEDEDDEEPDQWLVGETLDGTKTGTFPASHVQAAPKEDSVKEVAPVAASTQDSKEPLVSTSDQDNLLSENNSKSELPAQESDSQVVSQDVVTAATVPQKEESSAPEKPVEANIPETEAVSPSAPEPKSPSKPTSPVLAPKPSGLAARIAAFNKPQEAAAPPPLPRGKPGGWKRPAPAPGAAKPVLPGPPASQQARTAPTSSRQTPSTSAPSASPPLGSQETSEEAANRTNASFSAADAQSSIKMSLKERMAALQRGESSDDTANRPSAPPPKPAPGRIAEEKRKAALAGVGGAIPVKAEEGQAEITGPRDDVVTDEPKELSEDKSTQGEQSEESSSIVEGGSSLPEVEEEKTEEELESERRSAIAKRMAALGGRRMGGGPALFGAPAPIPTKKTSSGEAQVAPQVATDSVMSEEPSSLTTSSESKEVEQEPAQSGQTLAVPRRTAPPRKKKSSASSVTPDPPSASSQEKPSRQGSMVSNDSALERGSEGGAEAATDVESKAVTGKDTEMEVADGGVLAGAAVGAVAIEGHEILTEDKSTTIDTASSYDDQVSEFEPGTPISEGQINENARQLEEFIRTPRDEKSGDSGEEEQVEDEEDEVSPVQASAPPPIPVSSPSPPNYAPPSSIGRPQSARPPIPKVTQAEGEPTERTFSPAPTRAPPVPAAVRQGSMTEANTIETEIEENDVEEPIVQSETPTLLAKPKPRMAVAAELSEDEDEGEVTDPRGASALSPVTPAAVEQVNEPEELTEEEEDRQRRARIAAKMARMGGQPIMGAPIPFKNPSISAPAPVLEDERGIDDAGEMEPSSEVQTSLPRMASPPPIPTSKSPPPIPTTSSPPVPTKSPPPPIQGGNAALGRRLSQMSIAEDSSLGRRASLLSRPPVPTMGKQSREASMTGMESEDVAEGQDEIAERTLTPPPLPASPAPRAPPPQAPSRQPSQAQEEAIYSAPPVTAVSEDPRRSPVQHQQQQRPQQARRSGSRSSREAPRSSRDLDLMPSSRWWRHGLPVKLPPTLMRPDAYPYVSNEDQGQQHRIRIELIFEDYSSTVVEVEYVDDDAMEEATQLSQHHNFPPPRPTSAELQSWSQRFGAPVAKQAITALQSKTILGNGSSKGFISALVSASGSSDVLAPVGFSFGSIILAQAATTPVDVGADEIRVGDIVAMHGVDFKGKRGLTPYHATFGSTQEPTFACVIESEAKKRKLKCILVAGIEGKRSRAPEEVSLRLDDVKSGLLRVFRLAPKSGWLPN